MEVIFDEVAQADIKFWKKSGNIAVQKKIQKLILAIQVSPYSGIGKPEALKHLKFRDKFLVLLLLCL